MFAVEKVDNDTTVILGIVVKTKFIVETHDAVNFYQAAWFECNKEIIHYSDGDCVRYHCKLSLG